MSVRCGSTRAQPPNDGVVEMEDPRCKIAATEMEGSDCKGLLRGLVIETEDPRCNIQHNRVAIGMEYSWSQSVGIEMEDPRCRNMRTKW